MLSPLLVLRDYPRNAQALVPELAAAPRHTLGSPFQSLYEKIASPALRNKGYEEFAPMYRSRSYWSACKSLIPRRPLAMGNRRKRRPGLCLRTNQPFLSSCRGSLLASRPW
jgi:hypothetical protein